MYSQLLAPLQFLDTVTIDCPVFAGDVPFHPIARDMQWSGECGWCMSNICDDEEFQTAWMNKKQAQTFDGSPKKGPPSLRLVIWNLEWDEDSFHSKDDFSFLFEHLLEEIEEDQFAYEVAQPDTDVVGYQLT